ncbi:MAG: hypothetical protein ACKO0M_04300, partial [Cyanobium sp.]
PVDPPRPFSGEEGQHGARVPRSRCRLQPRARAGWVVAPGSAASFRWHGPLIPVLAGVALALSACQPAEQRSSGRVFPLPRVHPDDALAVVTRPGGEGLQIWLDPDTSAAGVCRPRWNPDAARLRGGDGLRPRAGGRAPRAEFYAAMARGEVRWQLRRLFASVCRRVSPQRRFLWREPPRSAAEFRPSPPLMFEERHLLSHPNAIRRAEKRLLGQPLTPEDLRDEELPPELPGP